MVSVQVRDIYCQVDLMYLAWGHLISTYESNRDPICWDTYSVTAVYQSSRSMFSPQIAGWYHPLQVNTIKFGERTCLILPLSISHHKFLSELVVLPLHLRLLYCTI